MYDIDNIPEEDSPMQKKFNGLALSGFVLSLSAALPFAAALLCLLGVMFGPTMALVFGELSGVVAAFGVAHSAIGVRLSYREDCGGAGFALAGLVIGTAFVAFVLTFAAIFIVQYYSGVCIAQLPW